MVLPPQKKKNSKQAGPVSFCESGPIRKDWIAIIVMVRAQKIAQWIKHMFCMQEAQIYPQHLMDTQVPLGVTWSTKLRIGSKHHWVWPKIKRIEKRIRANRCVNLHSIGTEK